MSSINKAGIWTLSGVAEAGHAAARSAGALNLSPWLLDDSSADALASTLAGARSTSAVVPGDASAADAGAAAVGGQARSAVPTVLMDGSLGLADLAAFAPEIGLPEAASTPAVEPGAAAGGLVALLGGADSAEGGDAGASGSGSAYVCFCAGCTRPAPYAWTSAADVADGVDGAPGAAGSLQTLANYLSSGYWTDTGRTSRWINVTGSGTGANFGTVYYNLSWSQTDSNGISDARKVVAREAFNIYEAVLGINFVETTSTDTFVDIFFGDNDSGAYQTATLYGGTGGAIDYSRINVASTWQGGESTLTGYTLQTFIHEIGHALGLGHQGNYNAGAGTPTYANSAIWENDSWALSIMSYWSQTENTWSGTADFDYAFLVSPMSVDWIALNTLYAWQGYGSGNAFTGNTVYGVGTNISAATSAAFNALASNADTNVFTIVDGGGTDTINFSNFAVDQLFNLNAASTGSTNANFSNIGGLTGNMSIAAGTIIENAISGAGDDTMYGNDVGNGLWGGGGDDTLKGAGGNDVLYGESGHDYLYGGDGNDTLYGGLDGDYAYGEAGNDVIVFTAGNYFDDVSGGDGTDTLDASAVNFVVTAPPVYDFEAGTITGYSDPATHAGPVSVSGIEIFQGGSIAEVIVSNGSGSYYGNGGNDTIYAGLGTPEVLDGGAGTDTLDTTAFGGGWDYTINMVTGLTNYSGESFTNFENLISGSTTDSLTGTSGANVITSGDGNDSINGGGGADTINAGAGDDLITDANSFTGDSFDGESGIDTLVADFTWVDDVSYDLGLGWMKFPGTTGTLYDTILNIENLTVGGGANVVGSAAANRVTITETGTIHTNTISTLDGNDWVSAGSGNDSIDGGAGSDTLYGGTGDDTILGGADGDWIEGDDGNDSIGGGLGDDTLNGGNGNDTVIGGGGASNDTIIDTGGMSASNDDVFNGNDGIDTLIHDLNWVSAVSFDLTDGWSRYNGNRDQLINIENLIVGGSASVRGSAVANVLRVNGTGANTILGEGGNDTVYAGGGNDNVDGGAGNDSLYGEDGNDTLNGGAGADAMDGSSGDDTFVVDNAGDTVTDSAGTDTVQSSITYALGATIENLTLTGAADLDGTGNALGNVIVGNGGDNVLDGGSGTDSLYGGDGDDTLIQNFGGPNEVMDGGDGSDTGDWSYSNTDAWNIDLVAGTAKIGATSYALLTSIENVVGGQLSDTITGDGGANRLDAQAGNDLINGGAGSDTVMGGSGNDTINGGADGDSMMGGLGDDTYYVDSSLDKVKESGGQGTDTVYSTLAAYKLTGNVENLTLNGVAAKGTGNGLDNVITGNAVANRLYGAAGDDSLYAGADAVEDRFYFDTALNAATNVDTLFQAEFPEDQIFLDNDIFSALLSTAGTQVGKLGVGFYFEGAGLNGGGLNADVGIWYNLTTGGLYYNPTGNVAGDSTLFATVSGASALLDRVDFTLYNDA